MAVNIPEIGVGKYDNSFKQHKVSLILFSSNSDLTAHGGAFWIAQFRLRLSLSVMCRMAIQ